MYQISAGFYLARWRPERPGPCLLVRPVRGVEVAGNAAIAVMRPPKSVEGASLHRPGGGEQGGRVLGTTPSNLNRSGPAAPLSERTRLKVNFQSSCAANLV